ncbi:N-acetylmuramoyl-L-alanine amidase-like domain-containing protein [Fontivita pretiosa]|uniref:N-acetylmuramoyl-L-alanine amidase-like domain-containing protein n=1 Tax=Fontivita pretiosa TaxID=2989684 RepID=UPI003D1825D2
MCGKWRWIQVVLTIVAVGVCAQAVPGCSSPPTWTARLMGASPDAAAPPDDVPLYQMSEQQVDAFLRGLHAAQPDLRQRVVHLARRNIGQPYEIYLLGESPFETIDPQPVYCLHHSDCVVFAEHTIAMALSDSWPTFLAILQRIRYKDGHIGVLTRNHFTEADWNPNNAWLARDITTELADGAAVAFSEVVDRSRFFKSRYNLDVQIPRQTWTDWYIPHERIGMVKDKLCDGDIVNFVWGRDSSAWVGHVGLLALGDNGAVHIIHSASPAVREEPIERYIQRMTSQPGSTQPASATSNGKARFLGFKFLRLAEDPWANLRRIDGAQAPRVTVPQQSPISFQEYLSQFEPGGGP